MRNYKKIGFALILFMLTSAVVTAQPFPQADPAVVDITKDPLGDNIIGTAVLKFRVANNSAGTPANGQIPANALDYTIQFNPSFTFVNLQPTAEFAVTSALPNAPDYVVHITNLVPLNPGDVLDFFLRVKGTQLVAFPPGATVTCNVDRTLPIACGNTIFANDNVSKAFGVTLVLPVKLLTLSAVLNNNQVALKWVTTDELNLSSFELERSTDGINFTVINNRSAAGNTIGETSYLYDDNIQSVTAGVIYYRVKAKDINGSFEYSRIRTIKLGKGTSFLMYPNPFTDQVNLQITSQSNAKGLVRLYNTAGVQIRSMDISLSAGVNALSLTGLERLSNGSYIIEIYIAGVKVYTEKLVK